VKRIYKNSRSNSHTVKTWLSLVLIASGSWLALNHLTDGFTALTSETARRNSIAAAPRELPTVSLRGVGNRLHTLQDILDDDGRVAIVNFFYSRCVTLCLAMGSELEALQDEIIEQGLQNQVRLISISFDPKDSADRLQRYAYKMHAEPTLWEFYSFEDQQSGQALLDRFGIVVIPAPLGEFEHNAAYHIVYPSNKLARIVDVGEGQFALSYARQASAQPTLGLSPMPDSSSSFQTN